MELADQEAGFVTRTEDGWLITINAKHDRLRRRLATAYGIARCVLQGHFLEDKLTYDAHNRSAVGESLDREAETFAAHILIPPVLLERWQTPVSRPAAELATAFDVPIALLEPRLESQPPPLGRLCGCGLK